MPVLCTHLELNLRINYAEITSMLINIEKIIGLVSIVIKKYSELLIQMAVTGQKREIDNKIHSDNFLSEIDRDIHFFYKKKIGEIIPTFIYASEEEAPHIWPEESDIIPEFMVIVDPLDTSELAVRGLSGYTHILLYSLREQCPILSIVGDMFHYINMFFAYRDFNGVSRAFLMTRNQERYLIHPSDERKVSSSLVTNYFMKPATRFASLVMQENLFKTLRKSDVNGKRKGRIGLDFGSIGLCHVAAGFTDAMFETAKGFYIWDILPGQYILNSAGGVISSLDGEPLTLNLNIQNISDVESLMNKRQKFVAASNQELMKNIISTIK